MRFRLYNTDEFNLSDDHADEGTCLRPHLPTRPNKRRVNLHQTAPPVVTGNAREGK